MEKNIFKFMYKKWGKALFGFLAILLVFIGGGIKEYMVAGTTLGLLVAGILVTMYTIIFTVYYFIERKKHGS